MFKTGKNLPTVLSDQELVRVLEGCILDYRVGEAGGDIGTQIPAIYYQSFPSWIFGDGYFKVSFEGSHPFVVVNIELKRRERIGKWRFLFVLTSEHVFEWFYLLYLTKKLALSSVKTLKARGQERVLVLGPLNVEVIATFLANYKIIPLEVSRSKAFEILSHLRLRNV